LNSRDDSEDCDDDDDDDDDDEEGSDDVKSNRDIILFRDNRRARRLSSVEYHQPKFNTIALYCPTHH
jgi:hypothetical protein